MSQPLPPLYCSSVEGAAVQRFGTGQWIGAVPAPKSGRGYEWNTELVVMIPADERRKHAQAYEREIREGSLIKRTEEDFLAQTKRAKAKAKAGADAQKTATEPQEKNK